MKCGFYESDITPPLGLTIPGYPDKRIASGVMLKLFSRAAAFELDGQGLIIISVDAISLDRTVFDSAVARIEKATGVPTDHILIHATHIHTGGPSRIAPLQGPYYENDPVYVENLGRLVGDSGILAWQRLEAATVKAARRDVNGISFIRNYRMADGSVRTNPGMGNPDIRGIFGTLDPELAVLFVYSQDGRPMGVLTNYALHHDTIGGYLYSSGYSGALSELLKETYGHGFTQVFINGACGNVNHVDVNAFPGLFRRDKDGFRRDEQGNIVDPPHIRIAKRLFSEIRTLEQEALPLKVDVLKGKKETLTVDRVRIPEEMLEEMRLLVQKPMPSGAANPNDPTSESYKRSKAEGVLRAAALPPRKDVLIQALRLGDAMLFAVPGEVYTEYGRMMKDASPLGFNMVAELANVADGPYVPTPEAFQYADTIYEAHPSCAGFAPEAGMQMTQKAIEIARTLA